MTTKVSDSYLVRKADLDSEREQILQLWRYLPNNNPALVEKLDWFYLQNPAGKGVAYVLVFKPEDRLVGVIFAGRRDFRVGAQTYRGVVIADFVIDPGHRSLGPGLKLQRYVHERIFEDFDLNYGFPGKRSGRVRQFDGYPTFGELDSMVLLVQPWRFMRRRLPNWLSTPVSFFVEHALRYFLLARTHNPSRRYSESEIDESFVNQLWQRVDSGNRAIGVRDWSFVNWRILSDPFNKHYLFGVRDENGVAAAYLAYKINDAQEVAVVDYLAVDTESFSALLAFFIRQNIKSKSTSVSIKISKRDVADYNTLKRFAFRQRKTKEVFVSVGQAATNSLDPELVHLNLIDNDV